MVIGISGWIQTQANDNRGERGRSGDHLRLLEVLFTMGYYYRIEDCTVSDTAGGRCAVCTGRRPARAQVRACAVRASPSPFGKDARLAPPHRRHIAPLSIHGK
ncbi:hypothetical protein EVAR_77761_1 [Eumeta japonica]|uniref:Uncharacterized protein n=1 Tax=Eumeta variegata TaxID=151549 RepID=A0A4C1TAU9_EUMVA|nr:hypothetical protein EVAR_77761_1 [Eumeta japonica]